jgi:hypothetical protein
LIFTVKNLISLIMAVLDTPHRQEEDARVKRGHDEDVNL